VLQRPAGLTAMLLAAADLDATKGGQPCSKVLVEAVAAGGGHGCYNGRLDLLPRIVGDDDMASHGKSCLKEATRRCYQGKPSLLQR
jgi:hypothetical protein